MLKIGDIPHDGVIPDDVVLYMDSSPTRVVKKLPRKFTAITADHLDALGDLNENNLLEFAALCAKGADSPKFNAIRVLAKIEEGKKLLSKLIQDDPKKEEKFSMVAIRLQLAKERIEKYCREGEQRGGRRKKIRRVMQKS